MNISTIFSSKYKKQQDFSFEYWNNEEFEKQKIFSDIESLENSKEQQFFIQELKKYVDKNTIKSFLSVCCGNLWIETNALKGKKISKLVGIDFSYHRVHKLAKKSIEHNKMACEIELVCGDILDFNTKNKFDIIYLSKAFHHIESPIILLRKLKNLLSKNGKIIICGEHYYSKPEYFKRFVKHILKYFIFRNYRKIRSFVPDYGILFPYSLEKGDIHYPLYQYDYFFKKTDFNYEYVIHKNIGFKTFILTNKTKNGK